EHQLPPAVPMNRRKSRLLIILVAVVLGVPAGFLFARAIRVPMVKRLEDYQPAIITRIYDHNGVPFAEYSIQRRIVVSLKDISPALVQAIVATEDADFYKHGGINPKAILRAGLKDLIAGEKIEGASTLTQQLAKQVFLTPEKSFRRKVNEAFLAVDIEKSFTKDQIFPEAAMIAGLARTPMRDTPITHPDRALARRNHVLKRMFDEHYIKK